MKNAMLKLCAYLVLMHGLASTKAQENNIVSGASISNTNGFVSYSIGQVFTTTSSGLDGTVNRGLQYNYDINVVSAITLPDNINLESAIYPNPTNGFLTLKVEWNTSKNIRYRLFDNNGILLNDQFVEGKETTIFMGDWVTSIYFLKIFEGENEIKTFKIIKK